MLEIILMLMLGLFVAGLILAGCIAYSLIIIPLKIGSAVLQVLFWLVIGIPLTIVATVALALAAPAIIVLAFGFLALLILCLPFLLLIQLIL